MYKITKLGNYRGATDTLIVGKQGRLLTKGAEQDGQSISAKVLSRLPPTIEAEVQDPDTDLDVSIAAPDKKEIPPKTEKPRDRTASTLNSSRQSQSLQHKFSDHPLQQYGRRNN